MSPSCLFSAQKHVLSCPFLLCATLNPILVILNTAKIKAAPSHSPFLKTFHSLAFKKKKNFILILDRFYCLIYYLAKNKCLFIVKSEVEPSDSEVEQLAPVNQVNYHILFVTFSTIYVISESTRFPIPCSRELTLYIEL
jgi:hypothetical protein